MRLWQVLFYFLRAWLCLLPECFYIGEELAEDPEAEDSDHDPEYDVAHVFDCIDGGLGHIDVLKLHHLLGECGGPVDEAREDRDSVEPADMNALDHLGRERADLDADERADQHPH